MKLVNYSIQDIIRESMNGSTIIGFGAGKALDSFCRELGEYQVPSMLSAIADNDEDLSHTKRKVGTYSIPVYAIEEILVQFDRIDIIIVTAQYFRSIYEQLKGFPQLEDTKVVFYGFVIDRYCDWNLANGNMDCEIFQEEGVFIPKIIHYCWFGRTKIPDRYREWMKSWKKYCPDYEIVEWNEDNYDVNKNEYMAEAYEAKKWGFVPDYARLDIIYQHGGIYLDTDVEIIQNLDPLLYESAFCGFQSIYSVALGLGFGAIAKNPTILSMRDDYDSRRFRRADGSFDMTASPIYQTQVLFRHGLCPNGHFQKLDSMTVYPKVFFSPMNHYNRKINKNHNTFSIHHFDGSWVGGKEKDEWARFKEIYESMKDKGLSCVN